MVQPCLIYLHIISLITAGVLWRSGQLFSRATEMVRLSPQRDHRDYELRQVAERGVQQLHAARF